MGDKSCQVSAAHGLFCLHSWHVPGERLEQKAVIVSWVAGRVFVAFFGEGNQALNSDETLSCQRANLNL